ncbi:MAG: hypothetical protein GTO45_28435 [Candidatus Aminicenantes bacterium]|nr:hypothetical protein [Candidatus Aminicenantes bacterium]NIM82725.1 hypothetical protein [Candidatus Aminicenantes bacterium]NIN22102.1 hypothetical protein [Candidatus Aminicenantes bacterium]NIN45861.1 hypothetical protein [Candidatus Aminicenantes bacterium]NIN88698.1 hypothetical protein [Candidatus Aminicenantes bacterium]
MKKIWTVLYILIVLHIIAPAVVSVQAGNSKLFLPLFGTGELVEESQIPFSISYPKASIEVLYPDGGEVLLNCGNCSITWSTSWGIKNVKIEYSTNNGATWKEIVASTPNDGIYGWFIPEEPSEECLVKITDVANPFTSNTSDSTFTIELADPTLILASPTGGESWQVGNDHHIEWVSCNGVGDVKLEYSYDNKSTWITIDQQVPNSGLYPWTIPNTPSDTCFIRISEADDGDPTNTNYAPFSIIPGSEAPEISLNRTELLFAALKTSMAHTGDQYIIINNSGVGALQWKVEEITRDANWLRIYNNIGSQSGIVGVGVEPFGLNPDDYKATLHITDPDASNSPQTVEVNFIVYDTLSDADPFGSFDTPVHGVTVMSSIPVTGWALDDIGIDRVIIRRNALPREGVDKIDIGDAVLVEGARPDIELAYPDYPMNYKAGWGYMMLTNMLPNGGNGAFTLYAYAKDMAGNEVLLGSKTITCDNASAVKPFGAIDTPGQGSTVSGMDFRNQGWVLTPMPNKIPEDGSTIKVYIDGQNLGNPVYNVYRKDIAKLFPGYANSNGAMAYFDFDTTAYVSGIHTIQWTATDNAGNTDGIGSRYFVSLQNPGYTGQSAQKSQLHTTRTPKIGKTWHRFFDILRIPVNRSGTVKFKKGYGKDEPGTLTANREGIIHITVPQDQRIVLHLGQPNEHLQAGYLVNGSRLQTLPIGSSINYQKGIFYWQVSSAYFGKYKLVFILEDQAGQLSKKIVHAEIVPKFRR